MRTPTLRRLLLRGGHTNIIGIWRLSEQFLPDTSTLSLPIRLFNFRMQLVLIVLPVDVFGDVQHLNDLFVFVRAERRTDTSMELSTKIQR